MRPAMTNLVFSLLGAENRRLRQVYRLSLALAALSLSACTIPLGDTQALQVRASFKIIPITPEQAEGLYDEGHIGPSLIEWSPKQAWNGIAFAAPDAPREPSRRRNGGANETSF